MLFRSASALRAKSPAANIMRKPAETIFASFSAAALSLAALATPVHASFDDQARCEPVGDGEHLVIFSARDSNKASVQYQIFSENADSKAVVTELTARYNYPESGARYEGGEYILLTTNSTTVLIYGVGSDMPGHTECSIIAGQGAEPVLHIPAGPSAAPATGPSQRPAGRNAQ